MKGKTMGAGGLVVAMVGAVTLLCCGGNAAVVLMDGPSRGQSVDGVEPAPEPPVVTDPEVELAPMRRELDRCVRALERDDFDEVTEAWHAAQEVVLGFGGDLSVEHAVLTAMTNEASLIDCRGGGEKLDALRCDAELQAVIDSLPVVEEGHHLREFVVASKERIGAVQTKLVPAMEKQREVAAEEAARLAQCGPEPVPSSWDGTVTPVVAYLKARARVAPRSRFGPSARLRW